jgi:two-component system sensor histidine kinase/response regulator
MATSDYSAIAGLDAADGLRRAGGDSGLYASLLRMFVEGHAGAADEIEASLRRGDDAVAERVAHSIKGVAGNIGAKAVQSAAGEVEKTIRTRAGRPDIRLLRDELAAIVAALDSVLGASEPSIATADPARAMIAAETLMPLLEQCDPGAIAVIESERPGLRSLFTSEGFGEFEQLVTAYAFDDAIDRLRAAVAGHNR